MMMTTLGSNATLSERLHYGEAISREQLADALELFEATLAALDGANLTTDNPVMLADELEALQEASCACNDEEHSDYSDLKEFFDECVDALNAHWPAAEAYDLNLRAVIIEAIARGDVEEAE
jgi:hypothetical protein